ncbi:MAG: SDR family oxidoreductase [Chloroflexi bacterium]|nr:SDR family oxidoreductase [Chloroflexota bacterium]
MIADLTGKTALVTGAGSGIGRGIARMLAEQGASVAVTDLNPEWAQETAKAIAGVKTLALRIDVTDKASVQQAIQRVISEWGQLDIVVNNAGVSSAPNRQGSDDREEDWDVTFDINVKGVVHCCDAAAPHMRERRYGKIINIASMAGHSPRRSGGAYAVSKAAVLRYTKGLAFTLAPHNINVNAICPGAVWTRFQEAGARNRQRQDSSLAGQDPEQIFRNTYEPITPLGRVQTPEDIGKMAAFLASEDARNVTGQCMHVDGGMILRD